MKNILSYVRWTIEFVKFTKKALTMITNGSPGTLLGKLLYKLIKSGIRFEYQLEKLNHSNRNVCKYSKIDERFVIIWLSKRVALRFNT